MALRPDSMASHLRRGQAWQAQRRQDEAIRDYVEAARLQSGAADPLLALAELYEARGDVAHAAEWYGRAAEVDPQNRALLYRLAMARYRAGRSASAIDPLRKALALDAGFDEAHYLLGVVLRDAQDVAGATTALERAIQANPNLIAAREELADVYRAQGRFADELTQLTALAALDPRPPRAVAIALAEARQGRFDAALATLKAARDKDPANSLAGTAIGRVHLMRAESTADPVDAYCRRAAGAAGAGSARSAATCGAAKDWRSTAARCTCRAMPPQPNGCSKKQSPRRHSIARHSSTWPTLPRSFGTTRPRAMPWPDSMRSRVTPLRPASAQIARVAWAASRLPRAIRLARCPISSARARLASATRDAGMAGGCVLAGPAIW